MPGRDTTVMLTALRKCMKDTKYVRDPLQAYIVPSCDAHNSEYLAEVDARREALSGFTGSAGTAIVTPSQALMWTDGRYHLQAVQEMDCNWTLMKDGLPETPSQADWLISQLGSGHVGVDPWLMGAKAWSALSEKLESAGIQLVPVETNLVDIAWSQDSSHPQPPRPDNQVFPLEIQFTGSPWQEKVGKVREMMLESGASLLVVSALDDVAWLYNLRGSDISFNPVFFSYAAITATETVLFLRSSQVSSQIRDSLGNGDDLEGESVVIKEYEHIKDYIKSSLSSNTSGKIWLSDTTNQALTSLVPSNRQLIKASPITLLKSMKNEVEIAGFEASHARDAAALCNYLCWLDKNIDKEQITEVTGADKLEQFRSEQENFMGLSFPSISSMGPNGAIIHYRPESATARPITRTELYLIDSGAQYKDGTTDVTRTVHFGTPTDHEKECFTRVLKGHIALASAVFPNKTKGHCIDSLARQYLWQVGLDYLHGTGHGVGSFLNVHEGPCGISWRVYPNDPGLQVGMILSDEPGYYENGNFGIRIESLVKVVKMETKHKMPSKSVFLGFEPVTVTPIQKKMIVPELMTKQELDWLNNYHQLCRDRVGPILKATGRLETLEWLNKETMPIG